MLFSAAQDALRRSMPNLAKTMPMTLPSHPSDPELDQAGVNTQTFTRRKPAGASLEKTPISRYGAGGLSGRSPRQGLSSTYQQRTQSPASNARGSASPQRVYNVRNVSPVRQARNVSPVRQARNVSPVRQARNVSPVRQARNVSPVRQARNVSPVRQARNVSPVRQARNVSPVRQARNVSPVNNGNSGYRVRNVSPGQTNVTPGRSSPAMQGRNMSPARNMTYSSASSRFANGSNQRTLNNTYTAGSGINTNTITRSRPSVQQQQHAAPVTSSAPRSGAKSAMAPPARGSGLPAPKAAATSIPRPGSANASKLPSPRK